MADSIEVFSYPEASLYIWGAASSAITNFAESIEITKADKYRKFLFPTTGVGYASRSQYVLVDRDVTMNIGQLYMGQSMYLLMNSAVNASSTLNFICSANTANSATFVVWSARCQHFQLAGRENNIWRATTTWIAPDCSGL